MAPKFEKPNLLQLKTEQGRVQEDKEQSRLLQEYDSQIFPGHEWFPIRTSPVEDFLQPYCGDDMSLQGLLNGLYSMQGRPVNWVEMGGGRGLAMRQVASQPENFGKFNMTNVDLFDYGFKRVPPDWMEYFQKVSPGIANAAARPRLLQADMQTVQLPEPADLITSVEATHYLDDPLGAMANWYNQLNDNGFMIIAADRAWTDAIRFVDEPVWDPKRPEPVNYLFDELNRQDISFAAMEQCDTQDGSRYDVDPRRVSNLVIQKKPGTRMRINVDLEDVGVYYRGFKASFYSLPSENVRPPIEIISSAKSDRYELARHMSQAALSR